MLSHRHSSELLGLMSLNLPGSSMEEELYRLPPLTDKQNEGSEEELSSDEGDRKFTEDIHTIDVTSSDFKNLPPEVRHEILLELIETRKQSSWKYLDSMPKESDSFSDFQMGRLLKRRAVQSSLDAASKEMGGRSLSMKDLEGLLLNQPNAFENQDLPGKRIAQSDDARYLLVQKDDPSEALWEAMKEDMEIDIKKDPLDLPHSSNTILETSTESADDVKEIKEELTQQEIYDLIKEENEVSRPEMTKLSQDRKVKLTDDVIEVLPLLGVKSEEIEGIKDGSEILKMIKMEKRDDEENVKENEIQLVSSEKIHNSETEATSEPKPTLAWKESVTLEPKIESPQLPSPKTSEEKFETIQDDVDRTVDDTTDLIKDATEEKSVENLFTQEPDPSGDKTISEESEDDFIAVEEPKAAGNTEPPMSRTIQLNNKIKDTPMEIVISTHRPNAESEDIFSDIFSDRSEEKVKEVSAERTSDEIEAEKTETPTSPAPLMTEKDLKELKESVENECMDLIQEQGKQERFAQNISEQMNLDAQELLRLFGVPYVVAPMEAEAQCAILNIIGLTDGTITDDSDIWLFGGKVVYKNFFNQKKHVLQYRAEDIERYFKLSREDLIKLALLVGSDYTPGLEGVGPVTALEILGAFPTSKNAEMLSGLKSFRDWISTNTDVAPTKRSLRRKMRNTKISPGFPSEAVVEAYLHPQVDDSKEPFSWAKPNVTLLQRYTKLKFGWNQEKCDALLKPVVNKMAENKNNALIEKYFTAFTKEASLEGALSKRVENALKHLKGGECGTTRAETDESEPEKKKRRGRTKKDPEEPSTSKAKAQIVSHPRSESQVPQKRVMEQVFEDRKRKAIKLFNKSKKNSVKRKSKTVVRQEVNLSESSSSSD